MLAVSAAKATGSGEAMWPKGLTFEDLPMDFLAILQHSLNILNWQENLTSDEMPPRWMWPLDWELEKHFEIVKNKRDAKFGMKGNQPQVEDDEPVNLSYSEFEKKMRS